MSQIVHYKVHILEDIFNSLNNVLIHSFPASQITLHLHYKHQFVNAV